MHPLHLSNIDKTVKTFIVDESKSVSEIARDIGCKLGLRNADELSLKRQQDDDEGRPRELNLLFFLFIFFLFYIFKSSGNMASTRPLSSRTGYRPPLCDLPPKAAVLLL